MVAEQRQECWHRLFDWVYSDIVVESIDFHWKEALDFAVPQLIVAKVGVQLEQWFALTVQLVEVMTGA